MERIAENVQERLFEAIEACDRVVDGGDAHDLLDALDLARGSMQAAYDLIRAIPTDARRYINWLEEELDKRVHRWISVEERLPGVCRDSRSFYHSITVLAIDDVGRVAMGCFDISKDDGEWWFVGTDDEGCYDDCMKVTHWMPLPEPPEE